MLCLNPQFWGERKLCKVKRSSSLKPMWMAEPVQKAQLKRALQSGEPYRSTSRTCSIQTHSLPVSAPWTASWNTHLLTETLCKEVDGDKNKGRANYTSAGTASKVCHTFQASPLMATKHTEATSLGDKMSHHHNPYINTELYFSIYSMEKIKRCHHSVNSH